MARGARLSPRSRLTAADVGAWLFTCNPGEFREIGDGPVDGWCAHPSYRVGLVASGQPALVQHSGKRQDFQRDAPPQRPLHGFVHHAHAAAAQLAN